MIIVKNITIILFLLTILRVEAQTESLYLMSVKGIAPKESTISFDIVLKANEFNQKCQTIINFEGQDIIEPHIFRLQTYALSNYRGIYNVDIELNRNLKDIIEKKIINNELQIKMNSVDSYMTFCKFQVYMLTTNSTYSTLIVRNSTFLNSKKSFDVPYNRLKTVDYSFNGVNKLFFNINFLNKQQ